MTPDHGSLAFGLAAIVLNLGWAWYASGTPERYMAFAFVCWALSYVGLLWPVLRRLFL